MHSAALQAAVLDVSRDWVLGTKLKVFEHYSTSTVVIPDAATRNDDMPSFSESR